MAGVFSIPVSLSANDTNECDNPSGESSLTKWTTGGTNTLALSTEQQWNGKNSLKTTYADSLTLFSFDHTFTNTSTTYYIKMRLYVPTATTCGNIAIDATGYTGATETTVKQYTNGTTEKDVWIELKATLPVAADAAGTLAVVASSFTSGSVYLDAIYISTNDGDYFDGEDEGAYWTGTPHLTSSVMLASNRLHGVETNLDDYSVSLKWETSGLDMPPTQHQTLETALMPGAIYQYTQVASRVMTFPVVISGSAGNVATLQSRRKAFFKAVRANNALQKQPYLLRFNPSYTARQLEMEVRTDALDFQTNAYLSKGIWRVIGHKDPYWTERGDKYAALDPSDTLAVSYLLSYYNGAYSALGNAMTGQVRALAVAANGDLYTGGQFLNSNGDANQDNICYYDVSAGTWNALSTGVNSNVTTLLFDPDGTTLYVGGAFTSPQTRIASWNGAAFGAFGTGMNGEVKCFAVHPFTGYLWVGGAFTTGNGVTLNYIGYWNGTTFVAIDSGVNSDVNAIAIHPQTGDVYVGGAFTTMGAGATGALRVAKWNITTSAWQNVSAVAAGGVNGQVNALAFDDVGNLYAGGAFTTVDTGISAPYLARWNGSRWSALTQGLDDIVEFLYWDSPKQELIVSGQFTGLYDQVVRWNGSHFLSFGYNFPGTATVYGYARFGSGNEYVAFDTSGDMTLPGITNSINNTGTAEAFPQLYIENTGAGSSARFQTLDNLTTGHSIYFSGAIDLSENTTLLFDFRPGKKRIMYKIMGEWYDVTGVVVSPASKFSAWHLVPGTNKVQLRVSTITGTPTLTAYMIWRNRHDTIDGLAAAL